MNIYENITRYDMIGHFLLYCSLTGILFLSSIGIHLVPAGLGILLTTWYFSRISNFLSSCESESKMTDFYKKECVFVSYASYFCLMLSLSLLIYGLLT